MPRPPVNPIDLMRQMRGENNYIVAFQKPGVADAALARDVRKSFVAVMRKGGMWNAEEFAKLPRDAPQRNFELLTLLELPEEQYPGELAVTEHELRYYVETFKRTGFTGGINWYRNADRDKQLVPGLGTQKLSLPCLMVTAEWDMALPPAMAAGMPALCSDLETVLIEKCGHWTQQEKPAELNRIMLDWLGRRAADLS
jgi:pimeloyl-ACP methyl ester carboxylesterase